MFKQTNPHHTSVIQRYCRQIFICMCRPNISHKFLITSDSAYIHFKMLSRLSCVYICTYLYTLYIYILIHTLLTAVYMRAILILHSRMYFLEKRKWVGLWVNCCLAWLWCVCGVSDR